CMLMGDSVLFGWSTKRVLALAIGFSAGFLLVGIEVAPYDVPRRDFAVASIVLLVGAATAVGCTHLLAILRASLAERQRELSELSTRLMSVQEEERRRLARELHDEFGQSLTAVNANLWLIERQAPADAAARGAHARRHARALAAPPPPGARHPRPHAVARHAGRHVRRAPSDRDQPGERRPPGAPARRVGDRPLPHHAGGAHQRRASRARRARARRPDGDRRRTPPGDRGRRRRPRAPQRREAADRHGPGRHPRACARARRAVRAAWRAGRAGRGPGAAAGRGVRESARARSSVCGATRLLFGVLPEWPL